MQQHARRSHQWTRCISGPDVSAMSDRQQSNKRALDEHQSSPDLLTLPARGRGTPTTTDGPINATFKREGYDKCDFTAPAPISVVTFQMRVLWVEQMSELTDLPPLVHCLLPQTLNARRCC